MQRNILHLVHLMYVLLLQPLFLHLSAWLLNTISGMWVTPSLRTDGSGCGILILVGGSYSSSLFSLLSSSSGQSNYSSAMCNLKSKYFLVFFAGLLSALLSDLYWIYEFVMATSKK